MTFEEKLKNLRKSRNLSQEELANELNVSRQAVSKWELGNIPEIENIIKISDFFDCSIDYLIRNNIYYKNNVFTSNNAKPQKESFKLLTLIFSLISIIPLLIIEIISWFVDAPIEYGCIETRAFIDYYDLYGIVYFLLVLWFLSMSARMLYPFFKKNQKLSKQEIIIRLLIYIVYTIGTYLLIIELLSFGIIWYTSTKVFIILYFALLIISTSYLLLYKKY